MLIKSKDVSDILLGDVETNNVVYISAWESTNNGEIRNFVIQAGPKYFKGSVTRETIDNIVEDEDTGESITITDVVYSHENTEEIRLEEVNKVCVKANGIRKIEYK